MSLTDMREIKVGNGNIGGGRKREEQFRSGEGKNGNPAKTDG